MVMKNSYFSGFGSKIKAKNQYYKSRGFYRYIGLTTLKILFLYSIFILLVFLIGRFLLDFDQIFQYLINNLSDGLILLFFFISESFLGLIPVDLFVIWTTKFHSHVFYLAILGVLSYIGGIISYQIGLWFSKRPKIREYTEQRLNRYITYTRKWGGAFIVVAALFPFSPFSLVVIAVSLLRYPFKMFLLYALTRLVRFIIQGVLFFDILNLDSWVI